jgi:hypothetical protein
VVLVGDCVDGLFVGRPVCALLGFIVEGLVVGIYYRENNDTKS